MLTDEQVAKLEENLHRVQAILEETGRILCNEEGPGERMWKKITYDLLPANAELLRNMYVLYLDE